MARQFIDLGQKAFITINGPLIFLNLTANIFYASCLIFPPRIGQKLKQPLNILLGLLVWSSIIYCVSLFLLFCVFNGGESYSMAMAWAIVVSYVNNSMTCSVWLNFYYYIQIVPSQRACLIWIKRNIRSVIYMALLFGGMICLLISAIEVADLINETSTEFHDINNSTWNGLYNYELDLLYIVCLIMIKVYILICLCIMTVSSFSTVHYLQRHIRNVAQGSSGFSTQKIQSQMRVTITGVCQGVLYLLYNVYNLLETFTNEFSPYILSAWVTFTVTTLYLTGTMVNLGIGQAAFRVRVVSIWKTITALVSGGVGANDVRVQSVNTW